MTLAPPTATSDDTEAIATRIPAKLAANEFPGDDDWKRARRITFDSDWQGLHPDPERQTEVCLLWSPEMLYLRFRARYREIYVYRGGPMRRDQLWDRDVVEMFLQSPDEPSHHYREFEFAPNGDWIDLAISLGDPLVHLSCNLKTRCTVDERAHVWTAEVALPTECLTPRFDATRPWRVNFFRIEGPEPNRFYSAWRPTRTPKPNFHVPEAFGTLRFVE